MLVAKCPPPVTQNLAPCVEACLSEISSSSSHLPATPTAISSSLSGPPAISSSSSLLPSISFPSSRPPAISFSPSRPPAIYTPSSLLPTISFSFVAPAGRSPLPSPRPSPLYRPARQQSPLRRPTRLRSPLLCGRVLDCVDDVSAIPTPPPGSISARPGLSPGDRQVLPFIP